MKQQEMVSAVCTLVMCIVGYMVIRLLYGCLMSGGFR